MHYRKNNTNNTLSKQANKPKDDLNYDKKTRPGIGLTNSQAQHNLDQNSKNRTKQIVSRRTIQKPQNKPASIQYNYLASSQKTNSTKISKGQIQQRRLKHQELFNRNSKKEQIGRTKQYDLHEPAYSGQQLQKQIRNNQNFIKEQQSQYAQLNQKIVKKQKQFKELENQYNAGYKKYDKLIETHNAKFEEYQKLKNGADYYKGLNKQLIQEAKSNKLKIDREIEQMLLQKASLTKQLQNMQTQKNQNQKIILNNTQKATNVKQLDQDCKYLQNQKKQLQQRIRELRINGQNSVQTRSQELAKIKQQTQKASSQLIKLQSEYQSIKNGKEKLQNETTVQLNKLKYQKTRILADLQSLNNAKITLAKQCSGWKAQAQKSKQDFLSQEQNQQKQLQNKYDQVYQEFSKKLKSIQADYTNAQNKLQKQRKQLQKLENNKKVLLVQIQAIKNKKNEKNEHQRKRQQNDDKLSINKLGLQQQIQKLQHHKDSLMSQYSLLQKQKKQHQISNQFDRIQAKNINQLKYELQILRNQKKELQKTIKELKQSGQGFNLSNNKIKTETQNLAKKKQTLQVSIRTLQVTLKQIQNKKNDFERDLKIQVEKKQKLEADESRVIDNLYGLQQNQIKKLKNKESQLLNSIELLKQQKEQFLENLSKLKTEQQALSKQVSILNDKKQKLHSEQTQIENNLKALKKQENEVGCQVQRLKRQQSQIIAKLQNLKNSKNSLIEQNELKISITKQIEKIKSQCEEWKTKSKQLEQDYTNEEQRHKQKLQHQYDQIIKYENKKKTVQADCDNLLTKYQKEKKQLQILSSKYQTEKGQFQILLSNKSKLIDQIQKIERQRQINIKLNQEKIRQFQWNNSKNQKRNNQLKGEEIKITKRIQNLNVQERTIKNKSNSISISSSEKQLPNDSLKKDYEKLLKDYQDVIQTAKNARNISSLFQGDIFQGNSQQKQRLVQYVEEGMDRTIVRSKLLYRLQKNELLNKVNPHVYVDNHRNLLILIKTDKGLILGGFSQGQMKKGINDCKTWEDYACIFNLTNNKKFQLKPNGFGYKCRALTYDQYYLMFGNSQIRIRAGQRILFSNFGIINAHYDSKKQSVHTFIGQKKERQTDMDIYQIYQLFFLSDSSQKQSSAWLYKYQQRVPNYKNALKNAQNQQIKHNNYLKKSNQNEYEILRKNELQQKPFKSTNSNSQSTNKSLQASQKTSNSSKYTIDKSSKEKEREKYPSVNFQYYQDSQPMSGSGKKNKFGESLLKSQIGGRRSSKILQDEEELIELKRGASRQKPDLNNLKVSKQLQIRPYNYQEEKKTMINHEILMSEILKGKFNEKVFVIKEIEKFVGRRIVDSGLLFYTSQIPTSLLKFLPNNSNQFSYVLLFKTKKDMIFGCFADGIYINEDSPNKIKCFVFNATKQMSLFRKNQKIQPIKISSIQLVIGADEIRLKFNNHRQMSFGFGNTGQKCFQKASQQFTGYDPVVPLSRIQLHKLTF